MTEGTGVDNNVSSEDLFSVPKELPPVSRMTFYGVDYDVNLESIRRRMVEMDLKLAAVTPAGQKPLRGIMGHSQRCGVSHMTFRRLIHASADVSLDSLNRVLAGLGLAWDEVVRAPSISVLAPSREEVVVVAA